MGRRGWQRRIEPEQARVSMSRKRNDKESHGLTDNYLSSVAGLIRCGGWSVSNQVCHDFRKRGVRRLLPRLVELRQGTTRQKATQPTTDTYLTCS